MDISFFSQMHLLVKMWWYTNIYCFLFFILKKPNLSVILLSIGEHADGENWKLSRIESCFNFKSLFDT